MDTDTTAQPPLHAWSSQGAMDVLAERRRQIEAEGWTPEHDDEHDGGELALAAACYATASPDGFSDLVQWPWEEEAWKPKDRRRNLIKAAALLLAEIERLDRDVDPDPHEDPQAIFGDPRC